jgi:hypothetical protein
MFLPLSILKSCSGFRGELGSGFSVKLKWMEGKTIVVFRIPLYSS